MQGLMALRFYACDNLPSRIDKLQPPLDAFVSRFNHYRPHDALDGQAPAEYLTAISQATPQSHMC